jgi:hypothetical protein
VQDQKILQAKFKFAVVILKKTITKWFSVKESMIHTLGMLLNFQKFKKKLACRF